MDVDCSMPALGWTHVRSGDRGLAMADTSIKEVALTQNLVIVENEIFGVLRLRYN